MDNRRRPRLRLLDNRARRNPLWLVPRQKGRHGGRARGRFPTLRYHWLGIALIAFVIFLWQDGRLNFLSLPSLGLPGMLASDDVKASTGLTGRASVVDGDTIEIHGLRIRLYGIDAPESRQTCRDGQGAEYRCGQRAANALADKIGYRTVSCVQRDIDRYGRIVAVCRVGDENLNSWLVLQGWAIAYRRFSRDYVGEESEAERGRRGIWQGPFTAPEEWRRAN